MVIKKHDVFSFITGLKTFYQDWHEKKIKPFITKKNEQCEFI
jgi:hypothetical protein